MLNNYYVMEEARNKAQIFAEKWAAAVVQIAGEIRYLQVVGDWFAVYGSFFNMASSQLFEAFTSTAAIVSMPGTTQVAHNKKKGWKIALNVFKDAAMIALLFATDGAALGAEAAEEAGAKAAEEGTKDAAKAGDDAAKAGDDAAKASDDAAKAGDDTAKAGDEGGAAKDEGGAAKDEEKDEGGAAKDEG